jgi:predicted kinase
VPVEAVWFQTTWETCLARNSQRPPDRQVPPEVMEHLRQQLATDPPTPTEGFALVEVV